MVVRKKEVDLYFLNTTDQNPTSKGPGEDVGARGAPADLQGPNPESGHLLCVQGKMLFLQGKKPFVQGKMTQNQQKSKKYQFPPPVKKGRLFTKISQNSGIFCAPVWGKKFR